MAESLAQLRQRNQFILQAAGEGIYGLDANGHTTFVNPAAAKMLGWTAEELIGQPMHSVLHHSYPDGTPYPREACPIYAAFKDGTTYEVADEVFWRKDGSSFPVEYTSTPIHEDGHLVGAVVVFRDITQRKLVENALRESEERFRKLFESSSDGIVLLDAQGGDIVNANPSFSEMLGYSLEELQSMNSADIHPHELPRFKAFTESVVARSSGRTDELSCLTKNGVKIAAEISASTFVDSDGGRQLIMAAVRDITDRKQAEEMIREAKVKIAVAQNEMKIARQIQESLLPSMPLKLPGVEITGYCQPADQVGGDYFDYFFRDKENIDVVIADVSGHSISSGLFMVETRSILRAQSHSIKTPGDTLATMNDSLYEDLSQADHFITMFYMQYNPASRQLTYANAGQCPPCCYAKMQRIATNLTRKG